MTIHQITKRIIASFGNGLNVLLYFLLSLPVRAFAWSYALDIDAKTAGRQKEDNALSTFSTLSTFALTGGLALTAALSKPAEAIFGKNQFTLILSIYAFLSVFTISGMVCLLRLVDGSPRPKRLFSRSTIVFGRWCLTFALCLFAVLMVLAWWGLLPGQPAQKYFDPEVVCHFDALAARNASTKRAADSSATERMWLRLWELWIDPGNPDIFVAEQVNPFDRAYQSFEAQLVLTGPYSIDSSVAFLTKEYDPKGKLQPRFRQLKFQPDPTEKSGTKQGNVFRIDEPDSGEKLLVFVKLVPNPATAVVPPQLSIKVH